MAVERENFGKEYTSDIESTRIDYDTIKKCDLVCCIPGSTISGGVHVELGWASANKKTIEMFLQKDSFYSPMVTGLSAATRVNYNYYQAEFSEEMIELIISRIRFHLTNQ